MTFSSAQYFLPAPSGASLTRRADVHARRFIDARTADYVVEAGRLKQDDGFTSKVVLALRTRLGSCHALPGFGSRLHEVKRADEQGRQLAEKFAQLALSHVARDIADLRVTATLSSQRPGAIDFAVSGHKGNRVLRANYTAVLR